jgi:CubicO group peptidase (beta-lactamase class C family)
MELSDILPRTTEAIVEGIDRGWHHGVQLYVSRNGKPLADVAVGSATQSQPLTTDVLMLWLSSGKPVTAVAVMRLVEQGLVDLQAPVSKYIEEFAALDKEAVTVWHLMTHTAGLEPVVSGWPQRPWEEIIHRISEAPLQDGFTPGQRAAYDPARTWFILGEVVHRVTGRPIERVVREEVFEPLGMRDSWMAIPRQLHRAYGERIGITYSVKDGVLAPTHGHSEDVCRAPSPGGNCRGPIRELGHFYEMLLGRGVRDGVTILKPETVDLMTCRHRRGMHDETFKHVVDFGLGLIVNSNRYGPETVPYGFGRYSSEKAFGHGGAQSSIGFADPAYGLVVTAVANGCPGEPIHNKRFRKLNTAIYEDLGLTSGGER